MRSGAKRCGIQKAPRKASYVRYGWRRVDGKMQQHKVEQKVIDQMLTLKKAGKTITEIAKQLNSQNIPAKKGGLWDCWAIKRTLMRERKEHFNNEKEMK